MTRSARKLVLWSPRILAILLILFISAFALDSVGQGLIALFMHLVPSFVLLLALVLAWRREWVGGVVFIALAVLYGSWAWRRWDWVALISGPLLVVGLLFVISWRHHGELHDRG